MVVGAAGLGVRVGGRFVAVATGGTGVGVSAAVAVGAGVAVGGTGVSVGGIGVAVGGIEVAVGGTGVAVGGIGVAVGGIGLAVGGSGVAVGAGAGPAGAPPHAASSNEISVKTTTRSNRLLWFIGLLLSRPAGKGSPASFSVRNSAIGWDGSAKKAAMGVLNGKQRYCFLRNLPGLSTHKGAENEI